VTAAPARSRPDRRTRSHQSGSMHASGRDVRQLYSWARNSRNPRYARHRANASATCAGSGGCGTTPAAARAPALPPGTVCGSPPDRESVSSTAVSLLAAMCRNTQHEGNGLIARVSSTNARIARLWTYMTRI
jgi:hypothetical protein